MRANSRSRLRWGVATALAVLALCAGAKALADGGGNGRLLAAYPKALSAEAAREEERQRPVLGGDAGKLTSGDDGYRIGDDSDIASVEGSANDDEDAAGELLDETF